MLSLLKHTWFQTVLANLTSVTRLLGGLAPARGQVADLADVEEVERAARAVVGGRQHHGLVQELVDGAQDVGTLLNPVAYNANVNTQLNGD